ncbi:two-component response regulator [Rhodopirellula maiorica SM1]|uniref:Two-component response regulator n=1 Tax=Rhodopirellula maiorica SM1 TaxID=1265738 RepID=M5RQC0_9BACT|nr:response regulator [Rhodopirellula maiorica]EMI21490.1 two-component response regulator [Rhodopirellula maiorica SM1]
MFDSSGVRILLVQSEPVLSELMSFRLQLLGYQIEAVGTGGEAIDRIRAETPHLVIVDTALRDGDGLEWLSRSRGEFSVDRFSVLVVSLDPSLETVERAFYAGAQDYLITPFDPVVLEQKIVALVSDAANGVGSR